MSKPAFAIVGCGTLGTALGRLLFQAGYPVSGVASKSLSSAQKAADVLETDHFTTSPWQVTRGADLVFLTTSDDAVESVCKEIAQNQGFKKGAIVLHCSGAMASDILETARQAGAFAGSMHPLQSFAGARPGVNMFEGILVSVEGDQPALAVAREIAATLGANHARVKSDAKALYHAAAVVASNYLVTVMDLALALNKAAGINQEESLLGLMPLVNGTLSNINTQGIPQALTGPIARGDVSTVEKHLAEMKDKTPELVELYQALGRHTVGLGLAKGSLPADAAEKMMELFKP